MNAIKKTPVQKKIVIPKKAAGSMLRVIFEGTLIILLVAGFFYLYVREQMFLVQLDSMSLQIDMKQKWIDELQKRIIDLKKQSGNLDSQPFQESAGLGFFGTLTVTGYPTITPAACEGEEMCLPADYVYLTMVRSSSVVLTDFLSENAGNFYVQPYAVGLGCYDRTRNVIYSRNEGDEGSFDNEISGVDLQKLLAADKDNPVTIEMVKPVYTSGKSAPPCYSHFRDLKLI